MDIQPQQPISDDQELAKVLAGITAGADGATPADLTNDLEQETAAPASDASTAGPSADQATETTAAEPAADAVAADATTTPPAAEPAFSPAPVAPAANGNLEAIKHDALNELRPLVDKLNLSAEEKFDTYLLLIRSTDDTTLVSPAFEAARSIPDETEKAQALFDIVKEIDYLSNPQKQAA